MSEETKKALKIGTIGHVDAGKSMGLIAATMLATMEMEASPYNRPEVYTITNPYAGLGFRDRVYPTSLEKVGERSTITKSQRKKRTSKNKQAKKLRRRNRK